jgi:hypothetical protein
MKRDVRLYAVRSRKMRVAVPKSKITAGTRPEGLAPEESDQA